MKKFSLIPGTLFLITTLLTYFPSNAHAAELQVLAGGAMAAPLNEIAKQFEKSTGHKIVYRFGTTPELIKLATSGTAFDMVVVPVDVVNDAATRATLTPGPTINIAHAGIAVAVKSGAARPNIGNAAALKKTLLDARAIATIPASATGTQILKVFDQLGIAEAMKAKTKAQPTPGMIAQSVTSGESDLGIFLVNVVTAPGLDVVGPFPPELQHDIVFTATLAAQAKQAEAARAFLVFLTTPAAVAVIKAMGMTPG